MAAAGNAGEATYVEDVFSTYLYAGNSSTQTITNGIDLDGEGGMVWIKSRNGSNQYPWVFDTERGVTKLLNTSTDWTEGTTADSLTAFNSDGFTVGLYNDVNNSGENIVSWTFRKAEKFFDVVTYTGNGVAGRTVAHNLGSVPACIIVKRTDTAEDWRVYHVEMDATDPEDYGMELNNTNARSNQVTWNNTAPTDSVFSLSQYSTVNGSGGTYVAYLFASDAGGFGDDGSESIIKCGSYTSPASGWLEVSLGWEVQYLIVKNISAAGSWYVFDVMREMSESNDRYLRANTSGSETTIGSSYFAPTADGFKVQAGWETSGNDIIYIAIRRPMKTPESGTEVYGAVSRSGTLTNTTVSSSFPVDLAIISGRTGPYVTYDGFDWGDRLRGGNRNLYSNTSAAENAASTDRIQSFAYQNAVGIGTNSAVNDNSATYINYFLKRATGFFDVVAYTGNGVAGREIPHNLGATPELMIVKSRSGAYSWQIYTASRGATEVMTFTSDPSSASSFPWNNTAPTSSVFTVGGTNGTNSTLSGVTYIAYLFATLAGVSKVGSYTGTGADLNVDCGFSAGARFILIKRTDSTGDWYVYDSVRGIVAGNDPYLLLNSTAAEVTGTDYIDPLSSGFTVTSSAPAALNASGGTYIFLSIA
jgi:hypothetical protein